MNTTMDCFTSTDAKVIEVQSLVKSAISKYILTRNTTTVLSVSFSPLSSSIKSSAAVGSNLKQDNLTRNRDLLGATQSVMIAAVVIIQTLSTNTRVEQTALNKSITSGLLQRSFRQVSAQSYDLLHWVRVCKSNVPAMCMAENAEENRKGKSKALVVLDQCSMSTSEWNVLYRRQGKVHINSDIGSAITISK